MAVPLATGVTGDHDAPEPSAEVPSTTRRSVSDHQSSWTPAGVRVKPMVGRADSMGEKGTTGVGELVKPPGRVITGGVPGTATPARNGISWRSISALVPGSIGPTV